MEITVSYFLMLRMYINSKQKDAEIKDYALCLCNIWKGFTINNMKITGLKGVVKLFSFYLNPTDTNDILRKK